MSRCQVHGCCISKSNDSLGDSHVKHLRKWNEVMEWRARSPRPLFLESQDKGFAVPETLAPAQGHKQSWKASSFWVGLRRFNLCMRRRVALGIDSWRMGAGEMVGQLSSPFKICRDWLQS